MPRSARIGMGDLSDSDLLLGALVMRRPFAADLVVSLPSGLEADRPPTDAGRGEDSEGTGCQRTRAGSQHKHICTRFASYYLRLVRRSCRPWHMTTDGLRLAGNTVRSSSVTLHHVAAS